MEQITPTREYPGSKLMVTEPLGSGLPGSESPKQDWAATPQGAQALGYFTPGASSSGRNKDSRTEFNTVVSFAGDNSLTKNQDPPLPFVIAMGTHGSSVGAIRMPYKLQMLVPPSSFSLSSSQISGTETTRNGVIPTLWGSSQPVIALQGRSPAFITRDEGLVTAAPTSRSAVTMKDSLGYRHFMSLVAMFKSNGYQHLKSPTEDPFLGDTLPGQTSRVIHVLDCIHISYDGTEYYGHFTDLSFTYEASSPYNFSYSMSFTVTGIKGDFVRGHIGDGANQDSGIIIGDNSGFLFSNIALNKSAVQVKEAGAAGQARTTELSNSGSSSGSIPDTNRAAVPGAFQWTNLGGLCGSRSQEFYNALPEAYRKQFDTFLTTVTTLGYEIILNSCIRSRNVNSKHFWGGAIDIQIKGPLTGGGWLPNAFNDATHMYSDTVRAQTIAKWVATGVPKIAVDLGLNWGGNFHKGAGDCVHFEVRDSAPVNNGGAANKGAPSAEGNK